MYIKPRLGNVEFESCAEASCLVEGSILDKASNRVGGSEQKDFILLVGSGSTWIRVGLYSW